MKGARHSFLAGFKTGKWPIRADVLEKTKIKLLSAERGRYEINSRRLQREPRREKPTNDSISAVFLSVPSVPHSPRPGVTLWICSQSDGFPWTGHGDALAAP